MAVNDILCKLNTDSTLIVLRMQIKGLWIVVMVLLRRVLVVLYSEHEVGPFMKTDVHYFEYAYFIH